MIDLNDAPPQSRPDAQKSSGYRETDDASVIDECLACIPADITRDDWVLALMVIKATLGDAGMATAKSWSQTARDKYNEADFKATWRSLSHDSTRGRQLGSLVHLARGYGYRPEMREPDTAAIVMRAARDAAAEANAAEAERKEVERRERNQRNAERFWNERQPLAASIGETYLKSRGLAVPDCPDLAFHPDPTDYGMTRVTPAMIAKPRFADGTPADGIHRTFLTDNGSGKAEYNKRSLSSIGGAAVHLAPPNADGVLCVAEGIETALAVTAISGLPSHAALNATNMTTYEWPDGVRHLYICADRDETGAGEKAANALAKKCADAGLPCTVMMPKNKDFNEDLMQGITAEQYGEKRRVALKLEDFFAYLPMGRFIHRPTRELWPASSVNSQLNPVDIGGGKQIPAAQYLMMKRSVSQMTWAPGWPELIEGKRVAQGGLVDDPKCTIYNLYIPPNPQRGNARGAKRYLRHIRKIYPDDWRHIVRWMAHRAQRPGEKINHALIFGGPQGIGKDTLLEPLRHAVGAWNFSEVSPEALMGRFNGYLKSVVMRVSEHKEKSEIDGAAMYERTKTMKAAPPETLSIDEKNIREYAIPNVTGVIQTTNLEDGIYLTADDRRNFVAWSECTRDDFPKEYWDSFWGWYDAGGLADCVALLLELDLCKFNPKAPPPRTAGFKIMLEQHRPLEDSVLANVLEALNKPAVTIFDITNEAGKDLLEGSTLISWLTDRKNRKKVRGRLKNCGYTFVSCPDNRDGLWPFGEQRRAIYAKHKLTTKERLAAAQQLSAASS